MSENKATFLDIEAFVAQVLDGATDPYDKIVRVGAALGEVQTLTAELGRARREEMETLIAKGVAQNEIGRRTNLSSSRMSQILSAGPAPERAFFGPAVKNVTVAVAQKLEGAKVKPGPVLSIDDLQAYDQLRALVEDLGLKCAYEMIAPPGNVRLNRDGLTLICGPRHSHLIAQVLESDDTLRFDKDGQGWHLIDHNTGTTYRSPEDFGDYGDIAYFGRLPRPDGKGHFLYVAGIHAAGAAGVVHYMHHELPSLYREVRNRRFSTLIQCRYDPDTHQVVSSERITPIYKHEG